jgi:uncharacterized protein
MTIKNIFINPIESRLRAGWRIALFIGAFAAVTKAVFFILIPFFTATGIVRSQLLFSFITYMIVFVVTWGMCMWIDRRPLKAVGLGLHERTLIELAQGVALGTVMMTVIFIVTLALGLSEFHLKPLTAADVMHMTSFAVAEFAVVAWGEELLFRGYMFQTLAEGTNRITAVGAFAVFFAVVHMANPNVTVFSLVNIALAGVWLSAAYFKTRGLWLPIGLHFSWNFFQSHVFSFPVSGIQMSDSQLGVLRDNGPAWITGGSFGPEGGAIATVVLVAGTLLVWYHPSFRMSARAWTIEAAAAAAPQSSVNEVPPA